MTEPASWTLEDVKIAAANCGLWRPTRNRVTLLDAHWQTFLTRARIPFSKLAREAGAYTEIMFVGQLGWAVSVALRFQSPCDRLYSRNKEFYWSPYMLLAELIQVIQEDLSRLEAVEALAVLYCGSTINDDDVVKAMLEMDIWPCPPT